MSETDLTKRASIAALLSIPYVGHATIRGLISYLRKHEIDWADFWVLSRQLLSTIGLSEKQINSIYAFKKEHIFSSYYEQLLVRDIYLLIETDESYPVLLRTMTRPPVGLFVRGVQKMQPGLTIAVVGTRKMTAYGKYVTETIVRELVQCGCSTVSGGMYGVDMTAHRATLAAGGSTQVILGHGFDHVYPAQLAPQHQALLDAGVGFYTPFAPQVKPSRQTFPIRNAVVAGCAAAILVTEAAQKSGSHITAQCGLDQGKTVFAVPGPITNPYSVGTASLLQQGASLYLNAAQLIAELEPQYKEGQLRTLDVESRGGKNVEDADTKSPQQLAESQVLAAVQSGLTTMQTLQAGVDIDMSVLSQTISQLEMSGKLRKIGGQIFVE
ncbi:MAG: DNA-processing protein DprA [Patescibacteria group bacterium]